MAHSVRDRIVSKNIVANGEPAKKKLRGLREGQRVGWDRDNRMVKSP